MTIGFCTNRKFLTLQVKKHEFTPSLPDFLIKCTKPSLAQVCDLYYSKTKFLIFFCIVTVHRTAPACELFVFAVIIRRIKILFKCDRNSKN